VEPGGVLLGIASNHVFEAATVLAHAGEIPYQQRKVLLVQPITGDAYGQWAGYAPGANQAPLIATQRI